jgi:hypothetical protein
MAANMAALMEMLIPQHVNVILTLFQDLLACFRGKNCEKGKAEVKRQCHVTVFLDGVLNGGQRGC